MAKKRKARVTTEAEVTKSDEAVNDSKVKDALILHNGNTQEPAVKRRKKRASQEAAVISPEIAGEETAPTQTNKDAVADDNITGKTEAEHFTVPYNDKSIPCERRGDTAPTALIFTHGAGGGLAAPAASQFADGFATVSPVVSFQGNSNLASREKMFRAVLEDQSTPDIALGGRSMGARAAAHTVGETTKALVLVSFPLVGGKKGDSREEVLIDLPEYVDVLFVFGDRDSMCDVSALRDAMGRMKARCWVVVVRGADHGMNLTPKRMVERMRRRTGMVAAGWLEDRDAERRYGVLSVDDEGEDLRWSGWCGEYQIEAEVADGGQEAFGPVVDDEVSAEEERPVKKPGRGKT